MALDYNQIRHRILELKEELDSGGLTSKISRRIKRKIVFLEDKAARLVSSRESTLDTDEDIRARRIKELLVLKDRLAKETDYRKRSYLYKAINNLVNKLKVSTGFSPATYVAPGFINSLDFSKANNSMYIVLI
jgi:hypothetical protein